MSNRMILMLIVGGVILPAWESELAAAIPTTTFPRPLDSYGDAGRGIVATLRHRATTEPFNVIATTYSFARLSIRSLRLKSCVLRIAGAPLTRRRRHRMAITIRRVRIPMLRLL